MKTEFKNNIRFGYGDSIYIQKLIDKGFYLLPDLKKINWSNTNGKIGLYVDYTYKNIDTSGRYKIGENDKLIPIEEVE